MDARDNQEKQYEVKITRHAEQSMREIAVYIAVDIQCITESLLLYIQY